MDKEDCIHALLSTLQKPHWKLSNSVTDWDLKNVLWKAGVLLTPEQVAALLAELRRRGFISGRERRSDNRIVAMWGVRIAPAGEDWLLQRAVGAPSGNHHPAPGTPSSPTPESASGDDETPSEAMEIGSD